MNKDELHKFYPNLNNKIQENTFLSIKDRKINRLNQFKNDSIIDHQPSIANIPSYFIQKIETNLKIRNDKTFGQVIENVKFILKNGVFTSIIRKISLAGSSDSIIAFKVSSK